MPMTSRLSRSRVFNIFEPCGREQESQRISPQSHVIIRPTVLRRGARSNDGRRATPPRRGVTTSRVSIPPSSLCSVLERGRGGLFRRLKPLQAENAASVRPRPHSAQRPRSRWLVRSVLSFLSLSPLNTLSLYYKYSGCFFLSFFAVFGARIPN